MKTKKEIEAYIKNLEKYLFKDTTTEDNRTEIQSEINALKWVIE